MKKPNITPGPWKLNPKSLSEDNDRNYFHISAKDWTSKNSLVQVVSWEQGRYPIKECTDRWKADAKAISAVPNLIEELLEQYRMLRSLETDGLPPSLQNGGYEKHIKGIEEALKKAGCK